MTAINDNGDLAGYYRDDHGNVHGFEALAVPEPGTVTSLGVALAFMLLWLRRHASKGAPLEAALEVLAGTATGVESIPFRARQLCFTC